MGISCYAEFYTELLEKGFSPAGSNGGVFSLCDAFDSEIVWYTGDPDRDPWQWRMRVLQEGMPIAYGKLFFGKAGYIAEE